MGIVAAPAAVLCGLFGATLLGALSYRRSAKRMAQALEAVLPAWMPSSIFAFFELNILRRSDFGVFYVLCLILPGHGHFVVW